MTPLQLASWLLESSYDYSTCQIDVPPEIADPIAEWSQLNIPTSVLFVDDDGGKGRENEAHITVKYGMTVSEVPEEVYDIVHRTKPFPVMIGRVTLFRNNEFDVVKCDIESPGLRAVNAQICRVVPNEDTYPDYHPHLTLAYVNKGSCDKLENMDIFQDSENREFTSYGMVFKGPGENDDPARTNEVLLFSKVKQHAMESIETDALTPLKVQAKCLVGRWVRNGLTAEEMHQRIATGNWGFAEKYWYNRQRLPKLCESFRQHLLAEAGEEADFDRFVSKLPITDVFEKHGFTHFGPHNWRRQKEPWLITIKEVKSKNGTSYFLLDAYLWHFNRWSRQVHNKRWHPEAITFDRVLAEVEREAEGGIFVAESGLEPPKYAQTVQHTEPQPTVFDTGVEGEPFQELPFPASAGDLFKFLRKKRTPRPVL